MACECATCGEVEKLTESYSDEVYIVDCGACGAHQEEYYEPFEDSAAGEMGWVFATIPVDNYPRALVLNTAGKGLASIFTKYMAGALCFLWKLDKEFNRGAGSREVHKWLVIRGYTAKGRGGNKPGSQLSRASVIFGLNAMVDQGILTFEAATGKGGHHKIYMPAMNPYEFKTWVLGVLRCKLAEVFNYSFWEVKP